MIEFRWNVWNLEHATQHGVQPEEAEQVVRSARRPYPRLQSRDRWVVIGRGTGGRFVQVVYIADPDGTFFIIHAMPLGGRRRRRKRRN